MLNGIFVDEEASIDPKGYNTCRRCGTWRLIHYKIGDELRYDKSCDEYIPSDNLEYLEWEYQRKVLRDLYASPMED